MERGTQRLTSLSMLLTLVLGGLFTSGCYTRQIDGIQRDLTAMENKLRAANAKAPALADKAETMEGLTDETLLQLESRLAELDYNQNRLTEEVAIAQESLQDIAMANASARMGGTGSEPVGGIWQQELAELRTELNQQKKTTATLATDMERTRATFDDIRKEMEPLIDLLALQLEGQLGTSGSTASTKTSSTPVSQVVKATSAEVAPPLPGSSTPQMYSVEVRDTLSGIAAQFGVSVKELKAANNLTGDTITLGQKLRIP